MISAVAVDPYSRRQLFANAAIAASRVGSYPCAARRISRFVSACPHPQQRKEPRDRRGSRLPIEYPAPETGALRVFTRQTLAKRRPVANGRRRRDALAQAEPCACRPPCREYLETLSVP
jgi:hypothetical protein